MEIEPSAMGREEAAGPTACLGGERRFVSGPPVRRRGKEILCGGHACDRRQRQQETVWSGVRERARGRNLAWLLFGRGVFTGE